MSGETSVASTAPIPAAAKELAHRRAELHGAFGNDAFGRAAEQAARFFGTPQYILGRGVVSTPKNRERRDVDLISDVVELLSGWQEKRAVSVDEASSFLASTAARF